MHQMFQQAEDFNNGLMFSRNDSLIDRSIELQQDVVECSIKQIINCLPIRDDEQWLDHLNLDFLSYTNINNLGNMIHFHNNKIKVGYEILSKDNDRFEGNINEDFDIFSKNYTFMTWINFKRLDEEKFNRYYHI